MGFFARGGEPDGEHSEALARIEAGGIPAGAVEPPITVLDLNDPRP